MPQATLYTINRQRVEFSGNKIGFHKYLPPSLKPHTSRDGETFYADKQLSHQIEYMEVHSVVVDGARAFVAIEPELADILSLALQATLRSKVNNLEAELTVAHLDIAHLKSQVDVFTKFATLPWYARIWRAMKRSF